MVAIKKLELDEGRELSLVTRTAWGAHLPRRHGNLKRPVAYVRYCSTGTGSCDDTESCVKLVKSIQETHMDSGFDDIPNNFLVGGDGVVYEGKGWASQPELPAETFRFTEDCIDIAYIGNYTDEDPPWKMVSLGMDLLKFGLRTRQIDPVFKIIPFKKDLSNFVDS